MFCRLYRSGSNNTTRTVPSKTNEALQDNDIVSLRRRQKSAPTRIWRSSRRRALNWRRRRRRRTMSGRWDGSWLNHFTSLLDSILVYSFWMKAVGFARSVDNGSLLHLRTQPPNKKIQKKTSFKKNIIHITRCVLRRQSGVRRDGGLAQLALPTRLTKFDISIHRKIKHDLSHNFPLHVNRAKYGYMT